MKKIFGLILSIMISAFLFAGCTGNNSDSTIFNVEKEISVISREGGSGTRGAFIELFGIEQKNAKGEKVDYTTVEADTTNNTAVMLTSVAGNKYAIGYISMGSLNDSVKALNIDGVEASVANIKAGSYKIARQFNIVTKKAVGKSAQDFIDFITSSDGQKVVEKAGYISAIEAQPYKGDKPAGKITIAGSSSVTPVMEKLKEAYLRINTNADIEIQQSDSTTGINSAIGGICDIGMASRELKSSESEKGLTSTEIAIDGIAVIVNNSNPIDGLKAEQVKAIYIGETLTWSEVSADLS